MLRIWMGRANTGKSRRVLEEIRDRRAPALLLVPEHASHGSERDLCRVCGRGASRYAEVLSLRQLATRVLERTGALADGTLDAGGKLLLMQLALREAAPQLTVYARPSRRAPFLQELVALCDELTACRVKPETLGEIAPALEGMSGEKARDVALIYAAYLARLHQSGTDRRDQMEKLIDHLEESGYGAGKNVYLDGFTYFTAQELKVLEILLRTAGSVTATLLGDGSDLDMFRQSILARSRLERLAADCGVPCTVEIMAVRPPETALEYLAQRFFGPVEPWAGDCGGVELVKAENMFAETEYAAAKILELVRETGCRFRDIAVAARNLDEYAATIENVFERFGIPVYLSRRSDVLEKPVLSLLAGALDAVTGGYEYEDMFRWLKTGLAVLLAAGFTVGLAAIRLSIAASQERINWLYENTSAEAELLLADAVNSVQSSGFLRQDTIDALLDSGYVKDAYLEGSAHGAVIRGAPGAEGGWGVHAAEEDTIKKAFRAFADEAVFLSPAGSGGAVDITYLEGWDGSLFAQDWAADEPFPVVLPKAVWEQFGDEVSLACKGFRRCEVAGFYEGELAGAAGEKDPVLMPLSAYQDIGAIRAVAYSKVHVTLDPSLNRLLETFNQVVTEISARQSGMVALRAVIWDEELRLAVAPLENSVTLMEVLYPVTLVLSLLTAAGIAALFVMTSAKEVAIMRILGTTKLRSRVMLALQTAVTSLAGLLLGLGGALAYTGRTRPELLAGLVGASVLCAMLYLLAAIAGAAASAAAVTGRNPLELLQVKE